MADRDGLQIDVGDVSPADIDQVTQEQEITEAFTTDGGDTNWSLQVWRIPSATNEKGRREAWLFRADFAEFPTLRDRIQRDYCHSEPGMFRVRVYKNNRLFKASIWDIDALPEGKKIPETQAVPAPQPDNQLIVLFATAMRPMFEQMQLITQELTKLRDGGGAAKRDPLEDLERFSTIVANMGAKQSAPSVDAQIGLFMKAFEFGRSIDGGDRGGDGEGIAGVFKTIMDSPLAKAAMEAVANPKPAPAAMPAPKIPLPSKPAIVTPPPQQPAAAAAPSPAPANNDARQGTFARLIDLCLDGAKRGSDPALYSDLLYDQLRDDEIAMLVNNPNAQEIAAIQYPAVAQYPEFFAGLIERLREIWTQQGQDEHAEGGAGTRNAA